MCDLLIVAIHKTNKVLFVKSTNINTLLIIEAINIFCVLDYHHPFCGTFINHITCKTFLIFLCKVFLSICTELAVIWGIKKDKIFSARLSCPKKIFKIKVENLCSFKMLK